MKGIIYLGAAVALLRSAAAFLPTNHDKYENQDQLVIQPAKGINKAAVTVAASTENIEAGIPAQTIAPKFPQSHDVPSQNSGQIPSHYDTTLHPQQPPKLNFTIGSISSQWAIAYTPYTSTLSCLSASSIRSDVATIARKSFTSIRLYSIDCSALRHVGHAARTHGLRIIIGIQLDEGLADAEIQLSEMIDWAGNNSNWDLIEMIVIGNEAIFNEHLSATALASFISKSRTSLRAAGFSGPVTTTEPLDILHQHRNTLCPTLDVAAANIHPFFHASVSAESAGAYVMSELRHLQAMCPQGLTAVNLETGWPSKGWPNGVAVPGYLEQWMAVAGILKEAGGASVFLGFANDEWKDEGEFGVERSWGCAHVFGEEGGAAVG
ncbi:MAG: hypothetical protein Q9161_008247 [Pseudevernia consocians]